MSNKYNAPHFILAAVKRIYPDLPELVGEDWMTIKPQLDQYIGKLETQANDYLTSTQLFGLLAKYKPAREQLSIDMRVQEDIGQKIEEPLQVIAKQFGIDPSEIDGLIAAMCSKMRWDVDPGTIPPANEGESRAITLAEGGVEGAKSVKYKNMRLDTGDFTLLTAGFLTTGHSLIDKPHFMLITAGILITVNALHGAMKIELSEQEASVFWGMIQAGENDLTLDVILNTTNAEREIYGLEPLTENQIKQALNKLTRIQSIRKQGEKYSIVETYTIKD